VLFHVLFVYNCVLPLGDKPFVVNKCIVSCYGCSIVCKYFLARFVATSVQRKQAIYQIELIISVPVVPCQIVHTTFDSDKCFRCWHVTYMDDFKDEYFSFNGKVTNQRSICDKRLNKSHPPFANSSRTLLSCCTE
jgi:hypothetical protein